MPLPFLVKLCYTWRYREFTCYVGKQINKYNSHRTFFCSGSAHERKISGTGCLALSPASIVLRSLSFAGFLHSSLKREKARRRREALMLLIQNGYMIDPKSGREGKLDILTEGTTRNIGVSSVLLIYIL